jgi:hypothetical protein
MESASKYPKVMDEIEVHSGRGEQFSMGVVGDSDER